ncbi:multiple inositol polyphosphate phosphatase 1-like [Hermetia illucens]|nr:multiple inositol polyphosphate phosphatase 1-like [Hermetia illucens]
MQALITSLVALVLCHQYIDALVLPRAGSYCYSSDNVRSQMKHFTSKTAYQVVKGTNFAQEVIVPHCKPVKFWILSRHGTRLPEEDQIEILPDLEDIRDKIIKNYKEKAAGDMCLGDIELIRNWVLNKNITTDKAQFLTTQGWNDLKYMAQDYKNALPELLSQYDENEFLFRHTDTQRTEASYKAFVEGLFGPNAYQKVKVTPPPSDDSLLAPHDRCQTWVDREDEKKGSDTEGGLFKKSDVMNEALERISARLGYAKVQKYKKIKQLWDMCRFEAAWFIDQPSAWCTAFTMDDVLVFEYLDDLGKEHANGYSTDVNPNIPCELMQDLLTRLSSDDGPRVTAYFSHSALIQLFATALGIQKDTALLTSSNFSTAANRKWRTSLLDPFAANYAVVKYDCTADPTDPSSKIAFFSNQRRIDFEGCRNGLCKLSDFVTKYKKYLGVNCQDVFCTAKKL